MTDPRLVDGLPIDFMIWTQVEREQLVAALANDGIKDGNHEILHPNAVHQEFFMLCAAGRSPSLMKELGLLNDGSIVCSTVYNLYPTSTSNITLSSSDPLAPPLIDPTTTVPKLIASLFVTAYANPCVSCSKPRQGNHS
jgi:hypothetical protein